MNALKCGFYSAEEYVCQLTCELVTVLSDTIFEEN